MIVGMARSKASSSKKRTKKSRKRKAKAAVGQGTIEREVVSTVIDEMFWFLENVPGKKATLPALASQLGITTGEVERFARVLAEQQVARMVYPVNFLAQPFVVLEKPVPMPDFSEPKFNRRLDKYTIPGTKASVPLQVSVLDLSMIDRPTYFIYFPIIGPYTLLYLNKIREDLARKVPVQTEEITDPRLTERVKRRFYAAVNETIGAQIPKLDDFVLTCISEDVLNDMYGLGEIEQLLKDDWIEEVAVNGATNPVSVYHRKFGWLKSNIFLKSEEQIYTYATQIGRKAGRELTLMSPIMDAHLTSGDRVAATLFPISTSGGTITIRRFARNPWSLVDFISPQLHTMSSDMAALLWLCIQYEMNMLVIGGTASGKTSALNTLCSLIPPSQRTITIEDTRELTLPSYLKWNWIPLTTRNPNPEGKGGIEMLDLMVSSLRMRPDRMIVGEVRKSREAEVMFEAMHTGHAVYSTVHADNAEQLVRRLVNPPISIPPTELDALHLIVVQYRDRRKGIRRTSDIAEITPGSTTGVGLNSIFKWKARTDSFSKANNPMRVYEELNLNTGMTMTEIDQDLADKKSVLEWMQEHNWRSVHQIGSLVGVYYKSPSKVLDAVLSGESPAQLLGMHESNKENKRKSVGSQLENG